MTHTQTGSMESNLTGWSDPKIVTGHAMVGSHSAGI